MNNTKGKVRALSALAMTCVAVFALSACGSSADKATETAANIAELTDRGFTKPVVVNDGDLVTAPTYDVGLGTCRIAVMNPNPEWGWTYAGIRDVDAVRLEDNADKLGLSACFQQVTATP